MSDPLRTVVVGAGLVGQLRAAAVRADPGLSLVGVVDIDLEAARRASRGRPVGVDLDSLAADPVDLVVVCTPAHLHETGVLEALRARAHVLCEKPLSPSVGGCLRLIAAAEEAGRILAVGFNHRYYPSIQKLRDVLLRGGLGEIDHARVFAGHEGLSQMRAEWMYRGDLAGGGAMMDLGLHLTDVCRFLLGEVESVFGRVGNDVWGVEGSEDNAIAVLRTVAGIPVQYQATWNEWRGYRAAVDVYGTRGMGRGQWAPVFNLFVEQSSPGGRRTTHRDLHPWVNLQEKLRGWTTTARKAFSDELRDLQERIQGREGLDLADGRAGLHAVAVAAAVTESSRRGEPVTLEEIYSSAG